MDSIKSFDGFESFVGKLGLGQNNPLASASYTPGRKISRNKAELDEMYRTSWIAGRAVDVVAEDMVRSPIDIQGSLEQSEVSELLKAYYATGIPGRLTDAVKWARLYGGAVALMLFDGHDLASPLSHDSIGKGDFLGLHVLDKHQVSPSAQTISELGPMLGYPEYYNINADKSLGMGIKVHHSRVLRFIGVNLPGELRRSEEGWGDSILERAYDRILALDSATHGGANLLYMSFLRIIGVENLRQILASGGASEKALLKMFGMIRDMQASTGITLIDKKDEFHTAGWSFAGMYDALQAFSEQLAGAFAIPLVRLLGQSPKGFSTGESDLISYYDTILTNVNDDKKPIDMELFNVLSRHTWGKDLPDDFTFVYESLYTPTEIEKAQIATADAQAVAGLYSSGIISGRQALEALKDSGRSTGRFSFIDDTDLKEAEKEDQAPSIMEGFGHPEIENEEFFQENTPQELSLNGAQVTSMVQIVSNVAIGVLPRDSGVQLLLAAFPINEDQAEGIMGDVGKSFKVDPEEVKNGSAK